MRLLLPLLLLSACTGPTDDGGDDGTDTGPAPHSDVVASDLAWSLNPDVGSVVHATWTQDGPATVHLEYSFDDDAWESTPSFAASTGAQEQVIVGIPFDTDAGWRVVIEDGDSFDGPLIRTGELNPNFPEGELTVSDPSSQLPWGRYLLTSINAQQGGWTGGHYWTYIIDRQGRVVWAHMAPNQHWTLFAQVSVTGDYFLWDEATYWSDWDDGARSTVHKAYLDQEIEEIETPGLHHAFVQLPDETLVWGSQDHGGGEALVEKVRGQPDETVLWTCNEDWPNSGGCESNGLYYQEETDSFLYSFYTNNSLVEVDRATGTSLWWAGQVRDGYSFDPPDSQFSWQHGISYTDTGTLLVSSEYYPNGRQGETWLLEYEVDHENEQLHYVWGSGAGTFASTNGDAWRLDNGNTLHVVGAAGVIREVDPAGEDVWRVDYHGTNLLGRGQFIEDLYALVAPR